MTKTLCHSRGFRNNKGLLYFYNKGVIAYDPNFFSLYLALSTSNLLSTDGLVNCLRARNCLLIPIFWCFLLYLLRALSIDSPSFTSIIIINCSVCKYINYASAFVGALDSSHFFPFQHPNQVTSLPFCL